MPNIISDGFDGQDGANGFDFNNPAGQGIKGNDANCNWWDDDCAQVGGPGGNGLQGGNGGPGGNGGSGGTIHIEVETFSILIEASAKGGKGGNGGRGGKGQDGGKGGNGGNGDDCELGRHGGNGGRGGDAGIGGKGGNGGDGGAIIVQYKKAIDTDKKPVLITSGGIGGRGGDPGIPGAGGSPGNDGATTGVFSTSSDCEDMGPMPIWGANGTIPPLSTLGNGLSGVSGSPNYVQVS